MLTIFIAAINKLPGTKNIEYRTRNFEYLSLMVRKKSQSRHSGEPRIGVRGRPRSPGAIEMTGFRLSRLCRNWQNLSYVSFCHSGLDPESISFSGSYATGCRIRHPGLDPGPA
jgi:hypothetical protein